MVEKKKEEKGQGCFFFLILGYKRQVLWFGSVLTYSLVMRTKSLSLRSLNSLSHTPNQDSRNRIGSGIQGFWVSSLSTPTLKSE